jgi:hypothetical protein
VRIFLAGLDASHLRSEGHPYHQAARLHGDILASFYFYVDGASHAGRTLELLPRNHNDKRSDLPGRPDQRPH